MVYNNAQTHYLHNRDGIVEELLWSIVEYRLNRSLDESVGAKEPL